MDALVSNVPGRETSIQPLTKGRWQQGGYAGAKKPIAMVFPAITTLSFVEL
jgi:hypothetical protein